MAACGRLPHGPARPHRQRAHRRGAPAAAAAAPAVVGAAAGASPRRRSVRAGAAHRAARAARPRAVGARAGRGRGRGLRCAAAAASSPAPDVRGAGGASDAVASVRAVLFYALSLCIALPIFAFMILISPVVFLVDRHRRDVYCKLNTFWATMSTRLFFGVDVHGRENLPPEDEAVVFVANHASYLDIYAMYHLHRSLKYISKLSNFLIPIIGWSMFLTGHVPLRRMDRKSQLQCLKRCMDLLRTGSSLIFFPEGTRSKTGAMASFKKGAFSVASKVDARVVPVTLLGAGELMRSGREGQLYAGGIKVVVHEPIECADAGAAMAEAEGVIRATYEGHAAGA